MATVGDDRGNTRTHDFLVRARYIATRLWFLAWFELYLEIYRHHHASLARLGDVLWPDAGISPQPGLWLRTVVFTSLVIPVVCVALIALTWRAQSARTGNRQFAAVRDWGAFGVFLCALGSVNQLLRHPPFAMDLTLRQGNGGFILAGCLLALAATALPRFQRNYGSRKS